MRIKGKKKEFVTRSEDETRQVAAEFALFLREGDVVLLEGALGAGKTVFVKGVLAGLGFPGDPARSPTFTLVREYRHKTRTVFHLDLYRVHCAEELVHMGYEEFFYSPKGISLIEWADKAEDFLPSCIRVRFYYTGPDRRRIVIDHAASGGKGR